MPQSTHVHVPSADTQAFTVALNISIIYGATVGIGKPDSGECETFVEVRAFLFPISRPAADTVRARPNDAPKLICRSPIASLATRLPSLPFNSHQERMGELAKEGNLCLPDLLPPVFDGSEERGAAAVHSYG